jgi:hypothetical protein
MNRLISSGIATAVLAGGLIAAAPAAQAQAAPAAASAVTPSSVSALSDKQKRRVAAAKRADRKQRAGRVPTTKYGVFPSAYVGKEYNPRYESKRRCIVKRESNGYYTAVSSGGTYKGAYQMSAALGRGAAWMMGRPDLLNVPVNRWSRFEQDEAFWTIFNHGRGAAHWAGGRWSC